jgi:hypothetical protein
MRARQFVPTLVARVAAGGLVLGAVVVLAVRLACRRDSKGDDVERPPPSSPREVYAVVTAG